MLKQLEAKLERLLEKHEAILNDQDNVRHGSEEDIRLARAMARNNGEIQGIKYAIRLLKGE